MTPAALDTARAVAARAAAEAGSMRRCAALNLASLVVEQKAPGDVVSRADRDAEALLRPAWPSPIRLSAAPFTTWYRWWGQVSRRFVLFIAETLWLALLVLAAILVVR